MLCFTVAGAVRVDAKGTAEVCADTPVAVVSDAGKGMTSTSAPDAESSGSVEDRCTRIGSQQKLPAQARWQL